MATKSSRPAVLIVEDDEELGAMLTEVLSGQYAVVHARDRSDAAEALLRISFSAVIIDRKLPDGDGLAIVKVMRSEGARTPIMVLSGLNSTDEVVAGFKAGANDYLRKPFDIDELEVRVASLLRGFQAGIDEFSLGSWHYQVDSRQLRGPRGKTVQLTIAENELLSLLCRNPDHVFSREEILGKVFNAQDTRGTVDTYVHYLREKTERKLIRTVRSRGYRLGVG